MHAAATSHRPLSASLVATIPGHAVRVLSPGEISDIENPQVSTKFDARSGPRKNLLGSSNLGPAPQRPARGAMRERPARADLEFGGAPGAAAVILLSHVTVYYVLLCVAASDGALYPLPRTLDGWRRVGRDLARLASPTPGALAAYLAWLGAQVGLALACPGPVVLGYPLRGGDVAGRAEDDRSETAAGAPTKTDEDEIGEARTTEGQNENRSRGAATPPPPPPPTTRLRYKCNALAAWWVTQATLFVTLLLFGDAPFRWIASRWGELATCAVVVADVASVGLYLHHRSRRRRRRWRRRVTGGAEGGRGRGGGRVGTAEGAEGADEDAADKDADAEDAAGEDELANPVYDVFMGIFANPRSFGGRLDWKLFTEIRASWATLFLLTLAASLAGHDDPRDDDDDGTGTIGCFFARCRISNASFLLLIAHWLYANACHKGEACVPFSFDVMREKFGWMLCFWNLAGVPFVYSANAFFVARNDVRLTTPRFAFVLVLLLSAYYVWDTSQAQRVRFRAKHLGVGLGKRPYAFPELPWSELRAPVAISTRRGFPLLASGWVGMARKIHYTADLAMACTWALACDRWPWQSAVVWFYPAFFLAMITHRAGRDERRCEEKYGDDWRRLKERVPNVWVPGVF